MTAKELLGRIISIRKAIDFRKTKIKLLAVQAENTAACLTGMPHNPTANPSPMETTLCRKLDLEREITQLAAERKALIAKIDLLEDAELSILLTLRYVKEERWETIMAEMNYSERHVFRLHGKAIAELDEKMKDGSKCQ